MELLLDGCAALLDPLVPELLFCTRSTRRTPAAALQDRLGFLLSCVRLEPALMDVAALAVRSRLKRLLVGRGGRHHRVGWMAPPMGGGSGLRVDRSRDWLATDDVDGSSVGGIISTLLSHSVTATLGCKEIKRK